MSDACTNKVLPPSGCLDVGCLDVGLGLKYLCQGSTVGLSSGADAIRMLRQGRAGQGRAGQGSQGSQMPEYCAWWCRTHYYEICNPAPPTRVTTTSRWALVLFCCFASASASVCSQLEGSSSQCLRWRRNTASSSSRSSHGGRRRVAAA